MPMFDYRCTDGHTFEALESASTTVRPCKTCGKDAAKVWLPGNANGVVGDEIDVEIKHGLCHADGTPRRFRSREELRRAEKTKGLVNYVTHVGSRGSDKSKHTTRWT
jgi:putative FmdB family regulatory protein